ncbi:dihydrodipicolinate synthase family protein [Halolamina sp.]|jgi:4-hydroxy-tetrahydrodipicolinate synthase/2-dehydro-3-deoxy-phosphogluconate/2-dehydro-3-deoxy-6-phosphogalactonate aldolase|uniref:dihydrodipicolinate synthase family protein n=1 Tax=Halolamina sp. TaxID=1940283 RepID=UPI000223BC19|nr:Dihydrodipicolinate synthase [halophilic archaeon DL31]
MTHHAPDSGTADPLDLHGVVPPTVTCFHDDGALDTETTAAHARYVIDGGAAGVFPLGTNGEFPLLDPDERIEVIEAVVEEVGEEAPVIAGVGTPGTRRTVAAAERAEDANADGLVVVSPYYYPIDDQGQVEHVRRVADAVDIPVYCYHIPSKTGNELSLEAVQALAAIDGVAGLKDSSKDVPWLGQAIDDTPELTFMAGSDSLLVPGLDLGCAGLVSAVANVAPELVVELYEAYDEGDRERAGELQSRVYDVRTALKRGPYMAGVKTALSILEAGPDPGPLRAPLRGMRDEDKQTLAADLEELDLQ